MTNIKGKITLLICLALSLLMLFALSSCNNTETPSNDSTNTDTNTDTGTDSSTDTSTNTDNTAPDVPHEHSYKNKICSVCGEIQPSEGIEYTLSDEGTYYTVTGIGACRDKELYIPSKYEGLPVTSIGDEAFYDCDSLTSITIPDSVTSIGYEAFYHCTSLTSINVNSNNANYKSIDGVLYNKDATTLICYPAGKASTSFTIPDSVTSIGSDAFYGCSSLTSVTIGNSVTSIGNWAFEDCSSLTSVTIGNSVKSIGNWAFEDCSSLTSINVNSNNANYKSIDGVLYNKDATTLICYPAGKASTSFTIPDSVTSIGSSAFEYCTSLTSVTIGNSVTSIGSSAFVGCTSLTSVTIGNSVTSIGDYAFADCTSLTSVTIPDSVTSIGSDAFAYCTSLTSITIPDSVTSMGSSAFYNCTSLTIYCEATSKPSGWSSDWNSSNCPVYWYSESEPISTSSNYWHYGDNGEIVIWGK